MKGILFGSFLVCAGWLCFIVFLFYINPLLGFAAVLTIFGLLFIKVAALFGMMKEQEPKVQGTGAPKVNSEIFAKAKMDEVRKIVSDELEKRSSEKGNN